MMKGFLICNIYGGWVGVGVGGRVALGGCWGASVPINVTLTGKCYKTGKFLGMFRSLYHLSGSHQLSAQ